MITKQGHEAIAQGLANTRRYFAERIENGESDSIEMILDKVLADIVYELKRDNSRLDIQKFVDRVKVELSGPMTDATPPTHLHHLDQVLRPANQN